MALHRGPEGPGGTDLTVTPMYTPPLNANVQSRQIDGVDDVVTAAADFGWALVATDADLDQKPTRSPGASFPAGTGAIAQTPARLPRQKGQRTDPARANHGEVAPV